MKDLQKKFFFQEESDSSEVNFKKYINAILRRKWILIGVTIISFMVWQFFLVHMVFKKSYELSTVVSFESPKNLSKSINPVADVTSMEIRGKAAVLKSFDFLKNVVLELNLNLKLLDEDLNRDDVFYVVNLDEKTKPGFYRITYQNDQAGIYFDELNKNGFVRVPEAQIKEKSDSLFIQLANTLLVLKRSVVAERHIVNLRVMPLQVAVKYLRDSIQPQLTQRSGVMTIKFKGSDPSLLVKVANTVTERFVQQNVGFSRRQTKKVVDILKNQLSIVKQKLENAEVALRKFKEKSSTVIVGEAGNRLINQINELEREERNLSAKLDKLNELQEKLHKNKNSENAILVNREIISFLAAEGDPSANALENEYNDLLSKRENLLKEKFLSKKSPEIQENTKLLEEIGQKILQANSNFRKTLQTELQRLSRSKNQLNRQLRELPNKQYQLAKLQRERDVDDEIYKSVLLKYNEAKLSDAVMMGDAYILQKAFLPDQVSLKLNPLVQIMLGIVLSISMGVVVVLGLNFLDKKIYGQSDVKKYIKLPILTSIPQIGTSKLIPKEVSIEDKKKIDPKLVTTDYSPTPVGEAYRALRTNLMYSKQFDQISTLVVTSTVAGEGKSLTAANLAVTFAQQKLPTLLIDCDLRRGVLHSTFVCQKKPGFSDLLSSKAPITLANMTKVIQKTHVPNLYIISSGSFFPNPQELLGSLKMKKTLEVLKEKFSVLILDTPPLNATADALIVSSQADGVIYVIREGFTNGELAKSKISLFDTVGGKMLGLVLNGVQDKDKLKSHYNYSYYNY